MDGVVLLSHEHGFRKDRTLPGHDYYMMDDLLTEEHKLIRDAAPAWVKQEVSPIIEDAAETQVFPKHLLLDSALSARLAPTSLRSTVALAWTRFPTASSCRSLSAATVDFAAPLRCRVRW